MGADAMTGAPPGFADPLHPTVQELRRASIFVHTSKGQGYGRLFGPSVDPETGKLFEDDGKIAGDEVLAFADDGSGKQNVAMLLQIPANMSTDRRCLIAIRYFVAPDATATKYVNDHGRFDVRDRICGYSYAATDAEGRPVAVPAAQAAQNFAIAPGGAPAGLIDVVNDNDPAGPRRSWLSASPSTGRQDFNLDG